MDLGDEVELRLAVLYLLVWHRVLFLARVLAVYRLSDCSAFSSSASQPRQVSLDVHLLQGQVHLVGLWLFQWHYRLLTLVRFQAVDSNPSLLVCFLGVRLHGHEVV